jgi:aminomethyltransferase
MDKRTPLYDIHIELSGAPVPFAGYLLPISYGAGIIKEHNAVREAAGIFDVSHMGEFLIEGGQAGAFLDYLLTNKISNMAPGVVRYSPMCNERGGVVDDLLTLNFSPSKYMLVVNASNKEKDFAWIKKHLFKGLKLSDISDKTGLIALQGKKAYEILKTLIDEKDIPKKNYSFIDNIKIAGKKVLVSRTGYTGEDGFELYCDWNDTPNIYRAVLEAGKPFGLIPCGLGARDTLRLEASMPLYGHEMNDDISPLETGLGMFVRLDKGDFIGKKAMLDRGAPATKRVGLEITDKGIAREHCPVYFGAERIGEVTSGTLSPHSGKSIAMALILADKAGAGEVKIEVRGRLLNAKTVPLPFYKKP